MPASLRDEQNFATWGKVYMPASFKDEWKFAIWEKYMPARKMDNGFRHWSILHACKFQRYIKLALWEKFTCLQERWIKVPDTGRFSVLANFF